MTVSDMLPKKSVASVASLGPAAGGTGGVMVQKTAAALLDHFQARPQTANLIIFVPIVLAIN